jgi:hypothetical protein
VLIAQNAWARRTHAELNVLVAHNKLEAPTGAPGRVDTRPRPQVPIIAFARDGGLNWVRAMYTQAAAGNPTNLIQSCNANAPGV